MIKSFFKSKILNSSLRSKNTLHLGAISFFIKTAFLSLFFTAIIYSPLNSVSAQNQQLVQQNTVNIYANKIVCENESDLPNWGAGNGAPSQIDSSTAQAFVNNNDSCEFVENWEFQWGFADKENGIVQGVDKLVGDHNGQADGTASTCDFNCGVNTQTGSSYNNWKSFDSATGTGSNPANLTINDVEGADSLWVREILTSDYIPYTYPNKGGTEDDVTAEMYCHNDIANFDNYDLVYGIHRGGDFYCVSFNVLKTPIDVCPNLEGNQTEVPEGYYFDEQEEACLLIPQEKDPVLSIFKSNNAEGAQSNGSIVTFTIVIELEDEDLKNVIVTDLPSDGFTYISGSWTSNSSTRGDLKDSNITTEPTYSSPGTWNLGDMKAGEKVTLTYQALIENYVEFGTYKDLAWSQGTFNQNTILANANSGTFVGTKVTVDGRENSSSVDVDIDKETKTVTNQVLGAFNIRELPATGLDTKWILLIAFLAINGMGFVVLGAFKANSVNRKFEASANASDKMSKNSLLSKVTNMFKVLVFAFIFSFYSANSYAAGTTVEIEEPKTPTKSNTFDITYVALDIFDRELEATCYFKNPNDEIFLNFGTKSLKAGGDSNVCSVDSGIMSNTGTYQFYVYVKTTTGDFSEVTSQTVNVEYDTSGPGTPKYIEKETIDSCTYEISVRTSTDGNTSYVEIYKSDKDEFDADASTLIKTKSVGSDEKFEFEDERDTCGKTYYYAVRAFDSAGNASRVRPEVITKTEEETEYIYNQSSSGTGGTQTGAILVSTNTQPESSQNQSTQAGENGQVLGDDSDEMEDPTVTADENSTENNAFESKLLNNEPLRPSNSKLTEAEENALSITLFVCFVIFLVGTTILYRNRP